VVPIKDYQVIMGLLFLQKYKVKLITANSTVKFDKYRTYTINCNEVRSAAVVTTAATGAGDEIVTIPDFAKQFPAVFAEQEPEQLPPLREGCNHKIRIIPQRKEVFKRKYIRVANAWMDHMKELMIK